jgi:diguanylate cyclase (GGDEF)-like protein/PAS domain S-box-containing protein
VQAGEPLNSQVRTVTPPWFATVPLLAVLLGDDGVVLAANDAAAGWFGWDRVRPGARVFDLGGPVDGRFSALQRRADGRDIEVEVTSVALTGGPRPGRFVVLVEATVAARHDEFGLSVVAPDGTIVYADRTHAALLGLDQGQLIGRDASRLASSTERRSARDVLSRRLETRVARNLYRIRRPGGDDVAIGVESVPLLDTEGRPFGFVCRSSDASSGRPRLEREAWLAAIVDGSDDAILSQSLDGIIQSWNRGAEEMYGWAAAEIVGRHITELMPPTQISESLNLLERVGAGERVALFQTVRQRKDGTHFDVSLSIAPVQDDDGVVLAVSEIARDITDWKRAERALIHQALHDPLTGLPNRALLEDRLAQALERSRRLGEGIVLVFMDIDNFKVINDTAGHQVGDLLLQTVAHRLKAAVRSVDTVARLGGDEFVVLCEGITDENYITAIGTHLTEALAEPVILPDREIRVQASIGVTVGRAEDSVTKLLSEADTAMYESKERRRGGITRYNPAMRQHLDDRLQGVVALHRALDHHELEPYYQPVVDLHSGRIVGAEALVRWNDPERGVRPAQEFVPLAEETGLIRRLGERILRLAGRQAGEWRRLQGDFVTMVNVSACQLQSAELLEVTRELLDEGMDPSSIVLEITETAIMEDAALAAATLDELRKAGFGIAIDDFGTGYSSLAYLKRLPATSIKIDATFSAHLPDPQDLSIVLAILGIADSYGLEVIAEGIETPEQAEILRELGCGQGQGFYFAYPLPAGEMSELLARAWPGPGAGVAGSADAGGRLGAGLSARRRGGALPGPSGLRSFSPGDIARPA